MLKEALEEAKLKFKKIEEHFIQDISKFRTGRASAAVLDGVMVEYYGSMTPISQVSNVGTTDSRTISVQPWEKTLIPEIEKAIKNSDISIAPIVDGKLIRLNIPPLSEERRRQLVQQVKHTGEQTKVSIRNIRREANKQLEKQQKDKLITEDDLQVGRKQVDDITKEYSDQADSVIKNKSDEVMFD